MWFLGHFVDVSGVRADPSKVSAISEGLVALRCRIAIPQAMRQEILECIHGGQQSLRDCVVAQNINRYQTEGGNMPLLSDNQRTHGIWGYYSRPLLQRGRLFKYCRPLPGLGFQSKSKEKIVAATLVMPGRIFEDNSIISI